MLGVPSSFPMSKVAFADIKYSPYLCIYGSMCNPHIRK